MSEKSEPQVYEVAVVGATGFLGSAIMRQLAMGGTAAVGFTLERPLQADGRFDPNLAGVRTVLWAASRINPKLAAESPELVAQDKGDLQRALDHFSALPQPPRVVSFSSGGTVYGSPAQPPYAETDVPAPVNAYGEAKLELEHVLEASGLETVSLRIANAYGPGQRPAPGQGVLAHWMEAVLAGQQLHFYGNPEDTRDYVFIDDIARAAVAAHTCSAPPAVVNVGSGEATSLEHLLEVFLGVVAPHEPEVVRHPPRSTDTAHSTLDVSLAREALDWTPQATLEQGVAAQWAWRSTQ